jgi:hypothetical protein
METINRLFEEIGYIRAKVEDSNKMLEEIRTDLAKKEEATHCKLRTDKHDLLHSDLHERIDILERDVIKKKMFTNTITKLWIITSSIGGAIYASIEIYFRLKGGN